MSLQIYRAYTSNGENSMIWYWYSSIALAFLSALLWFVAAALVPIPRTAWLVPGVGGGRPSPELDAILRKLRRQSWLNAVAAVLMAFSVLLQFVAVHGAP
jgi:hypothetical protein